MNIDNQNSPTSTSQSWIVDNIKSLISNHEDDLNNSHNNSDSSLNNNDVTLTDDKLIDNSKLESKNKADSKPKESSYFDINHDLSCDVEIEKSRTFAEYDNGVDRLPKRPFSPEEITENNNINNLLQNLGQYHHLNNFDFDNYSSNLFDFANANNILHSPSKYPQLNDFNELIYQPIQNQNPISSSVDLCSSIKKKKLTRTSTTSMILPLPTFSFTQPALNDQPDSNLNSAAFESFNQNFIQQFNNNDDSNYHSNPQSPSSNSSYLANHYNSYLTASSTNNKPKSSSSSNSNIRRSSLNAISNYQYDYTTNQLDTNTSTPFNQKLLINNSINKSASCCFHDTASNDPDNYYSYDSYSKENSFYNNNNMYYASNNESFRNNNMLKPFKNNENLDNSINTLTNNKFNKCDSSSNYNKRITKSSSNLFNNNNNNNNNISSNKMHKNDFIHSTSYDNIGLLNFSNNNKSINSSFSNYEINSNISNNNNNNSYEHNHSNLVPFFPQDHPSNLDYNSKWATTPNHNLNIKHNNNNGNNNSNNGGNNLNKFQHTNNNNNNHSNSTRRGSSSSGSSSTNKSSSFQYDSSNNSDQIVLHVRNLDYKISSDEWKRILLENFRKHCKENLSINVVTNPDKSLLGVVKLASKEDAKLAISCLHHKKIGYKRLNVNIAYSANTNSPKSKIVALLKASDSNEMALTRFIELYEQRYNQSITLSELFKLKEIVHISQSKDGQGRQIKLISKNYQHNLENEMQELLHTPYCSLHSHQKFDREKESLANYPSPNNTTGGLKISGWLPNVIVSLRAFKSAVHKLLNDHGGQMPLLSFLDCYKCCIFNDSNNANSNSRSNASNKNNKSENSSQEHENSTQEISTSYQLIIDNENGVSLEHLITCAQDVQIQMNEGYYKQLQWENDKSKPNGNRGIVKNQSSSNLSIVTQTPKADDTNDSIDDPVEESQRKINQFSHEVVDLLKVAPRCIIPLSKFNNEYHKKYGKQCRVADYGYTKLIELLESIPHILQILDGEFEKKLTLTHRVQVKRFGNDLAKVLKSHSTKQMFADEYPTAYEKHFVKQFDIRDYGVCYLEDMLAELPESTLCRKEIEGRTFIQIPKIIQMDEERLCTYRLSFDIIDMLKHKPRFSIQFNKFIPNFHHHFGRQLKLSKYGFSKLIELLESMPETVHVVVKDGLQFVQLRKEIMIDLITQNFVKLLEEAHNFTMNISLVQLEEFYTAKFQQIYYDDFECDNFSQFYSLLLFDKYGLRTVLSSSLPNEIDYLHYYKNLNQLNVDKRSYNFVDVNENLEWTIRLEKLNERELKKFCKLILKKLMENVDEILVKKISDFKLAKRTFYFKDFLDLILTNCADLAIYAKSLNKRAFYYMIKQLSDYFVIVSNEKYDNTGIDLAIKGLSEMYMFAKQIRNLYKTTNLLDMTISDLELAYKQVYKNNENTSINQDKIEKDGSGNIISVFPCKRLGFIDVDMLFSQGLSLIVTIKKYNEKSICLNKEFWPPSSVSPSMRQQNCSNQTNGTPSLHRLTMQSSSLSSSSFSRRNINLNE